MILNPDLHLHTTCSDGLTPAQDIVSKAAQCGVNLIAITDHDTVNGLAKAVPQPGMRLIAGVELGASHAEQDVHILGYGLTPDSTALKQYLAAQSAERHVRIEKMLALLRGKEVLLGFGDLGALGASPGRMHLARALVQKGYAKDISNAFDRWLLKGRPGYVKRVPRPASEVISFLRSIGAVPVLAHPGRMDVTEQELDALLDVWQDAGLQGIEVYHRANAPFERYARMARSRGLLITGGSDYHGDASHQAIGQMLPLWPTHDEDAHRFLEAVDCLHDK